MMLKVVILLKDVKLLVFNIIGDNLDSEECLFLLLWGLSIGFWHFVCVVSLNILQKSFNCTKSWYFRRSSIVEDL